MPVFISHRTADDEIALELAGYLSDEHDILCYVDHVDPEAQGTEEITNLIVKRVNQCTHLMALITSRTVGSWWVPFEIGVSRQADKRIASACAGSFKLPEFLTEWPVLTEREHLDLFAQAYHRDVSSRPRTKHWTSASRLKSAKSFHASLKKWIRETGGR